MQTLLGTLYEQHFASSRKERLFVSSVSFLVAFVAIRVIANAIHAGEGGPFHYIIVRGTHVHHLVAGILLLLIVGYLWLVQADAGTTAAAHWLSRLTALLYGIGAALTLDEFALWLNLEDVYWTPQGRLSIDAVIAFGALLSVSFWGGSFLRALLRRLVRLLREEARPS
jgi:hypothetical protein